ncbi:hypothetical protein AK51_00095 [Serratia nematodiphila DZ0503SBS1]|nr:hypothetical protein AK51_00095 [Serratia nematodiphila DZ0503SBS1]
MLGRVVEDQQSQLPLARDAVGALVTAGAAPALFRRAEHDFDVIQRLQRQRRELRVQALAFVQGVQIILQQQTQPLLVEVIAVEQREANIWHGWLLKRPRHRAGANGDGPLPAIARRAFS